MAHICPSCGKQGIIRMRMHYSRSPSCNLETRQYSSTENSFSAGPPRIHPPIPAVINTSGSPPTSRTSTDDMVERSFSYSSRLRTRETSFNYAESARKRAVYSRDDADSIPTPAADLGDYTTTHSPIQERQQDILELATNSWTSLYASSSVAATAPPPGNTNDLVPVTPTNSSLGTVTTISMEEQNSRIVATPQDRAMAGIYHDWIYRVGLPAKIMQDSLNS
jgi:hypothetical protein